MSETINEKIDRFIEYYTGIINGAMHAKHCETDGTNRGVPVTILLCSIFDSLGKCRFPNINKNGERFKKLSQISDWQNHNKISLLHLVRALEATNFESDFNDLKEYSLSEFQKRFPSKNSLIHTSIPIDNDIESNEIEDIWPQNNNKFIKLGNISIEVLKHENLLWLYRNKVTHEYRSPGIGQESLSERENQPYYTEISHISPSSQGITWTNKWELIYPVCFFEDLCRKALITVADHYRDIQESPFKAFEEGQYWIPKFYDE